MLTRVHRNRLPSSSRQRGGAFFTMLIFVMMLISTALMYYYFQRTKALQRELIALKSGNGIGVEDEGSSLWDWLPWNTGNDDVDEADAASAAAPTDADEVLVAPAPTPAATPEVETAVQATPRVDETQLPPSGAASTPRPTVAGTNVEAPPALDLSAELKPLEELTPLQVNDAEQPEQSNEPAEVSSDEPAGNAGQAGNEEAGQQEGQEPIQSMYDQLPPVRVRSPRQNR